MVKDKEQIFIDFVYYQNWIFKNRSLDIVGTINCFSFLQCQISFP